MELYSLPLIIALPFVAGLAAMLLPSDSRMPATLLAATTTLACLGLTLSLYPSVQGGGIVRQRFEWIPSLDTSWGTGAIVLASVVCFSALGSPPVVHEILIGIFITVTTPVTLMLLACAALYRERAEGSAGVPPRSIVRRVQGHWRKGADGDGKR